MSQLATVCVVAFNKYMMCALDALSGPCFDAGSGLIDAADSAAGLISVLESDLLLDGKWYDYAKKPILW